jgi:hypothetical protein
MLVLKELVSYYGVESAPVFYFAMEYDNKTFFSTCFGLIFLPKPIESKFVVELGMLSQKPFNEVLRVEQVICRVA